METKQNQKNDMNDQLNKQDTSRDGGILPPILLYFLGVPFVVVLLLWLLFFRG